ncbi:MAG: SDR family oxidoreductase [Actinobacteria bacterium]|nr:SDR family oxidoreductase [Actinomycetota bacterium]
MAADTIVITGATGGVGRALARLYGQRGANVALLARGAAGLEAAVREVESAGGRPLAIPTDVAVSEQVDAAAERAEDQLGPIGLWVNNAMVTVMARTWDVTPDEFRRVTEVNYLGYVHGTLAALRRMRRRDRGTLVQVGSTLAFRGIPAQAAYCATKHAIEGFTESLTAELLADGSRVQLCAVHLPGLNTTQFVWGRNKLPHRPQPVPPIYQPEVAAEAIAWAADRGRRTTYVAASTAATIWGNRLAKPLVARYLARTNIDAQQTDDPADPDSPDNLFEPADAERDYGSHGPFDDRAHATSPLQVLSRNRGRVAVGAALAAAAVAALTNNRTGEEN